MNRVLLRRLIVSIAALSGSSPAVAASDARQLEAKFLLAIREAPVAEVRDAIENAARTTPSGLNNAAFLAAVEALAALEGGAAALPFAREHRPPAVDPAAVRAAAVRGWTRLDAAATERWLLAAKPALDSSGFAALPLAEQFRRSVRSDTPLESEELDALIHLHLRTAAAQDGERAWQRALAIAETDGDTRSRRENYVLSVLETLLHAGRFERAAELTDELPSAEMRDSVRANLIALTAHHRPDLALRWLEAHSRPGAPDRIGLLLRLGEALAQRSLAEATSFLRDLPPAERTNDLRDAIIVHACNFDAAGIEALFSDLPHDEQNLQRLGMLWERVLRLQPQDARALLAELKFLDETERTSLEQMR